MDKDPVPVPRKGTWWAQPLFAIVVAIATTSLAYSYLGANEAQFAAAAAGAGATAGAKASVNLTEPKDCDDARNRAAKTQGENDGPAKSTVTGTSKGKIKNSDKCWSAFITEEGKKKKQKGERLTKDDYECKGRSAQTTLKVGSLSDISIPDKNVEKGTCKRQVTNDAKVTNPGKEQKPEDKGQQKPPEQGGGGKPPEMPQMPKPEDKPQQPQQPQQQQPCSASDSSGSILGRPGCTPAPVSSSLNTTPGAINGVTDLAGGTTDAGTQNADSANKDQKKATSLQVNSYTQTFKQNPDVAPQINVAGGIDQSATQMTSNNTFTSPDLGDKQAPIITAQNQNTSCKVGFWGICVWPISL